jgi:hypothetical protein
VAGRGDGGDGRFDAELPYRPADGAHPAGRALYGEACRYVFTGSASAAKNGVIALFTSRFLAVLRYVVPLAAGMLRLNAVKVYAVSLLSACAWAALYVGAVTGISAF